MKTSHAYFKVDSPENALKVASEVSGSYSFIAGGTDLMVNRFQGNEVCEAWIDISSIPGLKGVSIDDDRLIMGVGCTLEEMIQNELIQINCPILKTAIESIASPVIRKTATLGGNLLCENRCSFYNQSEWWRNAAGRCLKCEGEVCLASGGKKHCYAKFVSDTAIALISLGAEIEIMNHGGNRIVPLETIYSGDGVSPRFLNTDDLLIAIRLPLGKEIATAYKKLRKRETLDFTSLTTAVTLYKDGRIRIVLGGVHAMPVIVDGTADGDLDELVRMAIINTRIVDNNTYSRAYRKAMIPVFLNRCFKELGLK